MSDAEEFAQAWMDSHPDEKIEKLTTRSFTVQLRPDGTFTRPVYDPIQQRRACEDPCTHNLLKPMSEPLPIASAVVEGKTVEKSLEVLRFEREIAEEDRRRILRNSPAYKESEKRENAESAAQQWDTLYRLFDVALDATSIGLCIATAFPVAWSSSVEKTTYWYDMHFFVIAGLQAIGALLLHAVGFSALRRLILSTGFGVSALFFGLNGKSLELSMQFPITVISLAGMLSIVIVRMLERRWFVRAGAPEDVDAGALSRAWGFVKLYPRSDYSLVGNPALDRPDELQVMSQIRLYADEKKHVTTAYMDKV